MFPSVISTVVIQKCLLFFHAVLPAPAYIVHRRRVDALRDGGGRAKRDHQHSALLRDVDPQQREARQLQEIKRDGVFFHQGVPCEVSAPRMVVLPFTSTERTRVPPTSSTHL